MYNPFFIFLSLSLEPMQGTVISIYQNIAAKKLLHSVTEQLGNTNFVIFSVNILRCILQFFLDKPVTSFRQILQQNIVIVMREKQSGFQET